MSDAAASSKVESLRSKPGSEGKAVSQGEQTQGASCISGVEALEMF